MKHHSIRNPFISQFPLIDTTTVSYLDNAASTQRPQAVIDAVSKFYKVDNANVHRGLYDLSERATAAYEAVRDTIQHFINATHREEIIFTSGTTAGLNLIANSLGTVQLTKGDVILLSPMEHHSNLIPWQMVAKRIGAVIEYFDITEELRIDTTTIEEKMHSTVKIVSVQHISNAIGTIQPIEEIIAAAHAKDIPVVIDAAQSVPHMQIDVQQLDADFLVFSGHKMGGPTGTGVVYGKKKWLEVMEPWQGGGDMIREVTLQESTWADLPYKFEAGTPNIAGIVGLGAAITYLQDIGMVAVQEAVDQVYDYLLEQLEAVPYVTVLGPQERKNRSSIASFVMKSAHPHDIAEILNDHQVAVRAGHHCAQPLMKHIGVPATARASVYIYNTRNDVDRLLGALEKVESLFGK